MSESRRRRPALRALEFVRNQPWAITRDALETILAIAARENASPDAVAAELGRPLENTRTVTIRDGVAVIPVTGPMFRYANLFSQVSGATSYEQLATEFTAAVRNPDVRAIVLSVDSPGGEVNGAAELAGMIYGARGSKPIVAHISGFGASAAYWLASAADELVASETALVGSLGVIMAVGETGGDSIDPMTGRRESEFVSSQSPAKAVDLSDQEDRARLQGIADALADVLLTDVSRHRGISKKRVESDYGRGAVLVGQSALRAGLVDRIGTFEGVIAELARAAGRAGVPARTTVPAVAEVVPSGVLPRLNPFGERLVASGLLSMRYLASLAAESDLRAVRSLASASPTPADPPALHPSAPKASVQEERSMETSPAAAAPKGAEPDALKLYRERAAAINNLCAVAGCPEKAGAYIEGERTVEQITAELHEAQKAKVAAPIAAAPAEKVTVGVDRPEKAPFATFGAFIQAVIQACTPGGAIVPNLRPLAAPSGMSQGVPAEGGFLVAPQFSTIIWDRMNQMANNLLSLCDQYTVEGESLSFNANAEKSRVTGSRWGGIQGYWIAEADQITKSKPKFRQLKLEPQELAVLVYLTDKLMRNAPVALQQYVSRAAADEINFLVGDAIVEGDGAGKPLGLMNANAKIKITKETGQPAATIVQENITKMWKRLHPGARATAVWLHNVDIEDQLDALSTVVKNVAQTENVGGYANKVFDPERRTMKGRPLVACEYCATLGTEGDLILVDLQSYAAAVRGGVESALSMHLRFDYMEQVLRFAFAADGQPWLADAITPLKGSSTLSTIVTVETRS